MSLQNGALIAILVSGDLLGGAVGAYWKINRAKALFGAPGSEQEVERRQRYKAAHLGKAKLALATSAALFIASLALVIAASV